MNVTKKPKLLFAALQTDFLQTMWAEKKKYYVACKRSGFYIEGFSGYAFEDLARYCLTQFPVNPHLLKLLELGDQTFEGGYVRTQKSEIDLLISVTEDRLVRVIECKWGSHKMEWIDKLAEKHFELPPLHTRKNILFLDEAPSQTFKNHATSKNVKLISLEDLFS